jgi:hypothetical protein
MYYGMRTNGSVWDRPVPQHWTTHYFQDQMAAPVHEYDEPPSGRPVQTMGIGQTMPERTRYTMGAPQRATVADFMVSPMRAAWKSMKAPLTISTSGLGAEGEEEIAISQGAAIVIMTGLLVIGGILSYQAGKAMAPRSSSEKLWGWIGVPVGLFTGTLGLGIMGIVSNRKK